MSAFSLDPLDRKYEKVQIIKRALKNVKRGILDWYPI